MSDTPRQKGAAEQSLHDRLDGLAWVYRFSPEGAAQKVEDRNLVDLDAPDGGFLWIHVNLADKRGRDWLGFQTVIPEAARQVLVGPAEHQQIAHDGRHVWGVISDLIRDFDKASDNVAHLRFALGDRYLISARRHPLQGVEVTRREIESGLRLSDTVSLLEAIVERVIDAISGIVETNVAALNDIEDKVLDPELHDESDKLGSLRRICARLQRQLTGMRSIFRRLESQPGSALSADMRAAVNRLLQRISSLHEEVHSIEDRARLLQEEIASQISTETNRNLATLTSVTTLLLPPTLVTGMFGMNVKGLLFSDDENGYIYAMLICIASSGLVYLLMRRIGLIR